MIFKQHDTILQWLGLKVTRSRSAIESSRLYTTLVASSKPNWHSRNIRDVVCCFDQLVNNNNPEWPSMHTHTRAVSPARCCVVSVVREFDDGITSHWFPVYNAPEINVRPVGPPVNANPHDGYARLIYLYVKPGDSTAHWYSRYRSLSLVPMLSSRDSGHFYAVITQYCALRMCVARTEILLERKCTSAVFLFQRSLFVKRMIRLNANKWISVYSHIIFILQYKSKM